MDIELLKFKKLNKKLSFLYSVLFFLVLIVVLTLSYFQIKKSIIKSVDQSLEMQINLIKNSIEISTSGSLKNYYRATAYSALDNVNVCFNKYISGELSEEQAKSLAFDLLNGQRLGPSGYTAVIDNRGFIIHHPQETFIGLNMNNYWFTSNVMQNEETYFEYEWKNPGEITDRKKSMYSIHFKPWDWYISATGYSEDLLSIVSINDFEEKILSIKFGEGGYALVMDLTGTLLIHPGLKGENIYNRTDSMGEIARKAILERNGRSEYLWKNPGDSDYRKKLTLYSEIPQFGIIVAVTAYESEYLKPLNDLKKILIGSIILSIILIIIFTQIISKSITKPIIEIKKSMDKASKGNLTVRSKIISSDEIGDIGKYFNVFITKLEENQNELKNQLSINNTITNELRESLLVLSDTQHRLIEEERFSNMGRLLARFSHLLNTPIGTAFTTVSFLNDEVSKFKSLIEKNIKEKTMQEAIIIIYSSFELLESSIKKAVELINSFQLLQINNDDVLYELFNVHSIVQSSILVNWKHKVKESIKIELSCNSKIELKSYPDLLVRVLDQLISNSINHSFKNIDKGVININIIKTESGIDLTYKDSGAGIYKEVGDRIFEPFFSENQSFKSNGIGLNIIYTIITVNMKGVIKYIGDSNGVQYVISLPNI